MYLLKLEFAINKVINTRPSSVGVLEPTNPFSPIISYSILSNSLIQYGKDEPFINGLLWKQLGNQSILQNSKEIRPSWNFCVMIGQHLVFPEQ